MDLGELIGLAGDSVMLSTVYGYYEQTWIQMKKEDLAESSVSLSTFLYYKRDKQSKHSFSGTNKITFIKEL